MPLYVPPPRTSRFGSPLVLSRMHEVRPELVAEVKYLTWTDDNLLRQVVYEGQREDKPVAEVRRPVAHPKAAPVPNTEDRTSQGLRLGLDIRAEMRTEAAPGHDIDATREQAL